MAAVRRPIVLVTGGSGYIAGYCIAHLLQDGWRVRTTVTNQSKAERAQRNIEKITGKLAAIEFVHADLNSEQGWDQAVTGVDYVMHVASPVTAVDPKTDAELIRPALDGTIRVLTASRNAGVKRVVMTSSISAIVYGHGGQRAAFTELDWSDESNRSDSGPYDRSKTIAERAAWAWHETQGGRLELVAINPSFVIGPVLGRHFSPSLEVVKKLLSGSAPALPRLGFSLVDVRDIARLHVLAMTAPLAAGHRFIGSGDHLWMKEIASVLRQALGERARMVPSRTAPDFLVRLYGVFDPVVRSRTFDLGKERRVSSEKAKKMLGWIARPVSQSIIDTAQSLQAEGLV